MCIAGFFSPRISRISRIFLSTEFKLISLFFACALLVRGLAYPCYSCSDFANVSRRHVIKDFPEISWPADWGGVTAMQSVASRGQPADRGLTGADRCKHLWYRVLWCVGQPVSWFRETSLYRVVKWVYPFFSEGIPIFSRGSTRFPSRVYPFLKTDKGNNFVAGLQ